MDSKDIFRELCLAHAPSGREHLIYPIIKRVFNSFGDVSIDKMNNVVVHKKGKSNGSIMLMAHADEIFLIVTEICKKGFLKFKGVGVDPKTLISKEVIIHGKKEVLGIIGVKPPHLMDEDEKNKAVSADSLLIDTGYSKEKLEQIVKVGDFITLRGDFVELLNDNIACKATDDRAGIAAMYECAKELENINHDLDVYFVCSCQEEVGHRGAKMASYSINPDIAIAIDATFDNGPMGDRDRENTLGKGPVICIGPNLHPKLNEKIMSLAKEYKIPYGVEVEPGNTGTDAWDIQITRSGIPTLLISIPIKYMHTSVEVINMQDIKNTGRIIAKLIEKLRSEDLEEILCF
ncbi:M42 family metallopeptidase [Clostridium ganghwense]|uniref:M42 family metallopeptidase n=1 Tax=Clostridium ganghwense TaxID=312089 RepID=A0ABT4CUI0_9CLOT|nr:M42 family metallopeptidase [Clostridium ganghwense]MCY6372724.1 M42 family metallopeptidase [Clostridium ganghwense]